MSSEARRVKILVLIELVLGLCLAVYGIVLAVTQGLQDYLPAVLGAEGLIGLVFGARGALIANVPARIGKLATFALVIFAIQVVCVACMVYMIGPDRVAENPLPVILGAVPLVLSLIVAVLSRGIAKRAER